MDFPLWEILDGLGKNNQIAKLLLSRWQTFPAEDTAQKNEWYQDLEQLILLPMDTPNLSDDKIPPYSFWVNQDIRLLGVYAFNFKGIPDNQSFGWGLDLSNRQIFDSGKFSASALEPVSMVLLGENGSGKTSLYGTLEFIYTGKTSAAEKHKIHKEEIINYYKNINYRENQTYLYSLDCSSDNGRAISPGYSSPIADAPWEHMNFPVFFCSESDLAIIECSGIRIQDYLDSCVGLAELNEALKVTEHLKNKLEDEWGKRKDSGNDDNSDNAKPLSIKIEQIVELKKKLEKGIKEIRIEILPEAQEILSTLLSDFLKDEIELGYNLEITEESDNIKKNRIFNGSLKKKGHETSNISPREYFNNFRFKLYLISLKVAMAFYIMQKRKIAFPLVFDDVFDSSDFQNRLNTKKFIQKIFTTYGQLNINSAPLQLIFFTQDEVIAESIYEGIADSYEENQDSKINRFESKSHNRKNENKVVLAHLFSIDEIDSNDKPVTLPIPSKGIGTYPHNTNKGSFGPFINLCDIYRHNICLVNNQ